MTTIKFRDYKCKVVYSRYANNKRLAIALYDEEDYQPVATCTTNVSDEPLEYNEVIIKNWSENEGILNLLIDNNIIYPSHRTIQLGYVEAYVCYIKDNMVMLDNLLNKKQYVELSEIQNTVQFNQ